MVKDFKDIREFICLAQVCNYQEAADLLYISASSLSKHIMALENTLGVPLFDRTTRTVKLTVYGEAFYKYAQQMVEVYDECMNELNSLRIDSEYHLSIGYMERLEQCGIVEQLSEFITETPGTSIDTIADNNPIELLKNQKCQFIFDIKESPNPNEYNSILYRTDKLVAVVPKDHYLACEEKVHLEDLRFEQFIHHKEADIYASDHNFMNLCKEAGFTPHIVMSTNYTATVTKLVRQGSGIAILNKMNIPAAMLSSVATVEIEPEVIFNIYLIYSKKLKLTSVSRQFLNFIRSAADF